MAYRILSLDGGGTWALIQVRALIALYGADAKGQDVLADFDLVAATSGGSLVLGGLVENYTLGDLLAFFMDETKRRSIFSPTGSIADAVLESVLHFGPKYSAKRKLVAIEAMLPTMGTKPLTQVVTGVRRQTSKVDVHLLITGFDYDRNRANFFRSALTATPGWGEGAATDDTTLAEALHASTNAPVMYFDEAAGFPGKPDAHYWDGAITGCNNPVVAAVTEAACLGVDLTEIAALSIGTATVQLAYDPDAAPSPFIQPESQTGLLNDLKKLAGAICDDPPDVASFVAHSMTGGPNGVPKPAQSRIVRLNPLISPEAAVVPNTGYVAPAGMSPAAFEQLANLAMDALEPADVDQVYNYAGYWLAGNAPNQPIRRNGATLIPEIGYGWFQDAVAAWKAIK